MVLYQVKTIIKDSALNSSVIGLVKLVKRENFFNKLFWLFYLVLSALVSVWFILQTFQSYFNYEVVVNIQTIYEQPAQFPTVLLVASDKANISDLKDIIKDCRFRFDQDCKINPGNYFQGFADELYGFFNNGKNMTNHTVDYLNSTLGGFDDCLYLKIYVPFGFQLMIYNISTDSPDLVQNATFSGEIFEVSPGTSMQFIVEKTIETKLGVPYNACSKDLSEFSLNRTLIDLFIRNNQKYNQENCFEMCFMLEYILKNSCDCKIEKNDFENLWDDCYLKTQNQTLRDCIYAFRDEFSKKSILSTCSKYCPQMCDSTIYSVTTSTKILFDDDKNIDSNHAEIRIYYRSLRFTLITQSAKMTISDLISNIGGTLSLFIGLSFVSLFEIVELVFELILTPLSCKNPKVNSNQNFKHSIALVDVKTDSLA